MFSGRIGSGGGLALILYSLPRRFPLEPGTLYVRIHFFIVFVPLFLKFTMGARGHGFEPLHRPIVFARTKRLIGGGSLPLNGTQWVTMLVYATLWDWSIS